MVKKSGKGLGRGLDAIFATEHIELVEDSDKVVDIPLEEIKKNPYQPRTVFNEEKLNELKESIEKNGLLQPIVVKKAVKGYYIIAGERRFRAFELLGKKTIPAIIKEMSDEEMMIFAVLENLQREDLSSLEEAESYKNLMDKMELTQEELAKKENELKKELFDLRFQAAAGQLDQTARLNEVKKQIARVKTVQSEIK